MSARFSELVVDAKDPVALAEWWARVLECEVEQEAEDDGVVAYLRPPESVREIVFVPVSEPKTVKNRLHIDVSPHGCDQATELEHLLALGAKQIDIGQGDQTWHVLADPEGNEFCLLRTRFDQPA